jgi:hypothetical protein
MDDRVLAGSISNLLFSVKLKDGTIKDVKVTDFAPGEFRLVDSDYVYLTREDVSSIRFKFTNIRYRDKNRIEREYDISVGKTPFRGVFYILYIFNLDNPRHRGEFANTKGKTYLSEFQSSEGNTFNLRTSKGAANW